MKQLFKKIGIPAIALAGALAFISPRRRTQRSDLVFTWAARFIRITLTLTHTHTAPIIRHTLIRTPMDMATRTAVFTVVGVPAMDTDILEGTGLMDMDSMGPRGGDSRWPCSAWRAWQVTRFEISSPASRALDALLLGALFFSRFLLA